MRNLAVLLGVHTRLDVRPANDTPIPHSGFVELEASLLGEQGISTIHVPFLVTENVIENRIIGYNVIEGIVKINLWCLKTKLRNMNHQTY